MDITPETIRAIMDNRKHRPKPQAAPPAWFIAFAIFWIVIMIDIIFNGTHDFLIP